MANKIFSSYSSSKNKDAVNDQQLVVEAGARHMACIVKSGSKPTIKEFELFRADTEGDVDFEAFFHNSLGNSQLLDKQYINTTVFVNNELSLLVPTEKLNKDNARDYLNLVLGDHYSGSIFRDELEQTGEMVNIYRIQPELIKAIDLKVDLTRHTYSKIIDNIFEQHGSFSDLLKVLFYERLIIVVLVKNKKLHFIQTFTFQTPEDILYYLLSIAQRFQLNRDSLHVQLTGMFDSKSSMFSELRKFYNHISVEDADTSFVHINTDGYPRHFFTPFFNLAK